ncbi:Na+/H+ antiporter NhaA [Solirhodobacter olei]|uniref:Na+/H+ antiporter NhaA n=1 Tax=Solirhodobacter olei TaxID=2493082 RepID=UPI000FDAC193|nr:Na+/H+ antiporter NhaA [Solirhodobacter olei]
MYRVSNYLTRFALSLAAGALLATIWANVAPEGYSDFVELLLSDHSLIGYTNPDALFPFGRTLTMAYLTGDALMALFFLYLGKEFWEALVLRNGALRGSKAVAPLVTAAIGAAVPALIYAGLSGFIADPALPAPFAGWPIVLAGDVTLSYVIARSILGSGHPALRFLLLVSIADDILALLVSGLAFPEGGLHPAWLLLPLTASLGTWLLFNWLPQRLDQGSPLAPASGFVRHRLSIWPYALAGALSWYGMQQAGLMPALGLLPIVPAIPHTDRAFGVFAAVETRLHDMLNRIAQLLVWPVTAGLFLFALTHAGAPISAIDELSLLIALALLVGKPLGFLLGGWLSTAVLSRPLPAGMSRGDLATVGAAAAAGLAVPLFSVSASLPDGTFQDSARLGLILSVLLAPLALRLARALSPSRSGAGTPPETRPAAQPPAHPDADPG